MWRAFFCGLGISLLIVGAECLVVDRAVFALPPAKKKSTLQLDIEPLRKERIREWEPPEWAPWTLLSAGAVLVLYTAVNRE